MEKTLLIKALRGQSIAEFSTKDVNADAIHKIYEELNIDETKSARALLYRQNEVFAIISEVIEEIMPKDITNIMGAFAEVKEFERNAEVQFQVKGAGKRRARLTIQKGARGGIYRAARIDNRYMGLDVEVETVGMFVSLEDILLGTVTLAELYQNILQGFEERIYQGIVAALRTAKTLAPGSHIFSGSGLDLDDLDAAIRVASAYGDNVVVIGFKSMLSGISNMSTVSGSTPNVSVDDVNDIRATGRVNLYKGTPVLELPNYILKDGTTASWTFKESDLFVLPGDSKPVKVALKGQLVMEEASHPTGSKVWNAHKMIGVGLLLADNVCIVTDSAAEALDDGEF